MTDINEQELESSKSQPDNDSTENAEPIEKMVPQSVVDNAIKSAKVAAYAKGQREALTKGSNEMSQDQELKGTSESTNELGAQQNVAAPAQQSMGGMSQMSPDQIRSLIAEENQKHQDTLIQNMQTQQYEAEAHRIANEFVSKLSEGSSKHEDFNNVVGNLEFANMPELTHLANGVENTADVVYDLAKNPSKLANLLVLTQKSPRMAQAQISELSSSIKKNEAAKNEPNIPEPLSQISPSPTSTDNGKQTIRDLRDQPWLKG